MPSRLKMYVVGMNMHNMKKKHFKKTKIQSPNLAQLSPAYVRASSSYRKIPQNSIEFTWNACKWISLLADPRRPSGTVDFTKNKGITQLNRRVKSGRKEKASAKERANLHIPSERAFQFLWFNINNFTSKNKLHGWMTRCNNFFLLLPLLAAKSSSE